MSLDFDRLQREAEAGNCTSMENLALSYLKKKQSNKNLKKAFEWFDKARIEGGLCGMAHCGWMLVMGEGVKKNTKKGLYYLTVAAERGSDVAAYWLGNAFFEGKYGLPVDFREARQWLQKAVSGGCKCKNLAQPAKANAQRRLNWMFQNKPEVFPKGTRARVPGENIQKKPSTTSKNSDPLNSSSSRSSASLEMEEKTRKESDNSIPDFDEKKEEEKEAVEEQEEIQENSSVEEQQNTEKEVLQDAEEPATEEHTKTEELESQQEVVAAEDDSPGNYSSTKDPMNDVSFRSDTSEKTEKQSGNPLRSSVHERGGRAGA